MKKIKKITYRTTSERRNNHIQAVIQAGEIEINFLEETLRNAVRKYNTQHLDNKISYEVIKIVTENNGHAQPKSYSEYFSFYK